MKHKKTVSTIPVVFKARKNMPGMYICHNIPRAAWDEIHKADAVENLDRKSLEARFGFTLPPGHEWRAHHWFYKRAAIELLHSLGYIVKILLPEDNIVERYTPLEEKPFKRVKSKEDKMKHIRNLDKETREIIANNLMRVSDFRAWEAGHHTKHATWISALCLLEEEIFFIHYERQLPNSLDWNKDSAYFTIETQRPHLPDEA